MHSIGLFLKIRGTGRISLNVDEKPKSGNQNNGQPTCAFQELISNQEGPGIMSDKRQSMRLRAGKVVYDEVSKIATPDSIQGIITVKRSEDEDSFSSFVWSPRENVINDEKEELLIIPGDVTWKHVKECKTGRVFELRFASSGARHLFWSQEVNGNEDDPSELSTKDQQFFDFIQELININDEEEIEEDAPAENATVAAAPDTTQQTPSSTQPIYDLNDVFTTENLEAVIDNADEETLEKLYRHLPESFEKNRENLRKVLFSNYFRRSAHNLSNALNNGGGFVVSRSLDYSYEGEGVRAYLNAIKKKSDEEKAKEKE